MAVGLAAVAVNATLQQAGTDDFIPTIILFQ
jgi:hypothetical protein